MCGSYHKQSYRLVVCTIIHSIEKDAELEQKDVPCVLCNCISCVCIRNAVYVYCRSTILFAYTYILPVRMYIYRIVRKHCIRFFWGGMVAWGCERRMLSQSVFGTTYTWIYKSLILFMATEFCCDTDGSRYSSHTYKKTCTYKFDICVSQSLSLVRLLCVCVCVEECVRSIRSKIVWVVRFLVKVFKMVCAG